MTAISVLEVFGASAAAFGGIEGIKWLIKRFFPKGVEERQDEANTKQVEVDVEKSLRAMFDEERKSLKADYESRLKEEREGYLARIKDLHEANDFLNDRITDLLKAGARKDEIIEDKTIKIRELQEKLAQEVQERIADAKENGRLSKLVLFYRAWHCEREYGCGKGDCKRRKPEQNPPLKYSPIEAEASTDGIFIREVAPEMNPKDESSLAVKKATPNKNTNKK